MFCGTVIEPKLKQLHAMFSFHQGKCAVMAVDL
jgi:hypothetical protein